MEMKMSVDHIFAIDKLQNNLIPVEYKLDFSNLPSLRNKISFNFKDYLINYNISNVTIKKVIQFLLNNLENYNINLEIHGNDDTNNYGIIFFDKNTDNIIRDINEILNDNECRYLEINKNIIKNNLFEEVIFNITIKRNIKSFHQNDDSIRKIIYSHIFNEVKQTKFNNLVCLGGEMYIYGKILEKIYNYGYFFSDTQSIIEDSINNISHNHKKIELIDYKKDYLGPKINFTKNTNNILIINISKSGLKDKFSNEILDLEFTKIIYISCNLNSFNKDFLVLQNKYRIYKYIEFAKINIYFFEK